MKLIRKKKNTRMLSEWLIVLILTSCFLSLNGYGREIDRESGIGTDLNLDLPQFEKFVISDDNWYGTDEEGFRNILKIYSTYQTLGDLHLYLTEEILLLDEDVAILGESVKDCKVTLARSEEDRDFVYKLRESDLVKGEKLAKKQRIRAIFYGVGGGVVALAAGLLIGIFAF